MQDMLKEPSDHIEHAEKALRTTDHIIYITYPLIKDINLLKKIIDHLYDINNSIMNAILKNEEMYKRIRITDDAEKDFECFKTRCAPRFNLNKEDISTMTELLAIGEKHSKSSTEFIRKDKLVIVSNNLRTESINIEQLKKYLNSLKLILNKAKTKINDRYI